MPRSYAQTTQAPCPECGQPVDLEIFLIVDLAERPDLADRIRQGDIHAAPCPHCGNVGGVDAPLLIFNPLAQEGDHEGRPYLIFSPAQRTTADQDREHAAGLLELLRGSMGDAWQDEWLESLASTPRELLPTLLDGGELPSPARGRGAEGTGDLADLLIAWIKTPDWRASEAYLQEHAADLLTGEAEAVLEQLRQGNPDADVIPQHQTLLRRCRAVGIEAAYREFHAARTAGTGLGEIPDDVRPILRELDQPAGRAEMPRRVQLCQQALSLVERTSQPLGEYFTTSRSWGIIWATQNR